MRGSVWRRRHDEDHAGKVEKDPLWDIVQPIKIQFPLFHVPACLVPPFANMPNSCLFPLGRRKRRRLLLSTGGGNVRVVLFPVLPAVESGALTGAQSRGCLRRPTVLAVASRGLSVSLFTRSSFWRSSHFRPGSHFQVPQPATFLLSPAYLSPHADYRILCVSLISQPWKLSFLHRKSSD